MVSPERRDPTLLTVRTRWAVGALVVLVLARAAFYLLLGPGFVGDDWSLAGANDLDGHQGHFILESRPGSWVVFTAVYRAAGLHPVALFALVTVGYLAVVLLLFVLLGRFFATATALFVTAVWVLAPTHNTITVWGATSNSLVGMTLALVGLLLLTRGRWLPAAIVMAASVLTYELATPLLLLAPLLLPAPWQLEPPARVVRPIQRGLVFALVAAAAIWSATHSVYPATLSVPNPVVFWSAHFGSGLFATATAPALLRFALLAASAAGVVVCLVAWTRGDRGRESGPTLVLAGLAVMAVGAWVTVTLPIASHGVADRLYAVSSVGAALVIVGLLRWLRGQGTTAGVAGVVGLVMVCVIGQAVSLRSWSEAGDDSVALLHYLDRHFDDAGSRNFVVGPRSPYRNGILGVSGGHAKWTLWVWFDTTAGGLRTADTPAEFAPRKGEIVVDWSDVLAESDR